MRIIIHVYYFTMNLFYMYILEHNWGSSYLYINIIYVPVIICFLRERDRERIFLCVHYTSQSSSACACIFIYDHLFVVQNKSQRATHSAFYLPRKEIRVISHLCFLLSVRFSLVSHVARPQADSNTYADCWYKIYLGFTYFAVFFCQVYRFKLECT